MLPGTREGALGRSGEDGCAVVHWPCFSGSFSSAIPLGPLSSFITSSQGFRVFASVSQTFHLPGLGGGSCLHENWGGPACEPAHRDFWGMEQRLLSLNLPTSSLFSRPCLRCPGSQFILEPWVEINKDACLEFLPLRQQSRAEPRCQGLFYPLPHSVRGNGSLKRPH